MAGEKCGTLDDQSHVDIRAHLWTKRKADWITLPSNTEILETQPNDLKAWRTQLMKDLEPR